MPDSTEQAQRLCLVVIPEGDTRRFLDLTREHGFSATRLASTGGFLRRGSSTVLVGCDAQRVTELVSLLHEHFPKQLEQVPLHSLPWWDEGESAGRNVEVRAGGAVMFVLRVDRLARS